MHHFRCCVRFADQRSVCLFLRRYRFLILAGSDEPCLEYAVAGLPLFAVDYIFFGINVITIGYYTSIERINLAMRLTLLRGILPVLFFFILPAWFGVTGIWLAVAAGDITTTILILLCRKKV